MLSSLETTSVLDVSDLGSSKTLKEAALGFVVRNMDVLVFKDIFSRILKSSITKNGYGPQLAR